MSEVLFTGHVNNLSKADIKNVFKDVLNFDTKEGENIIDLLVNNKICQSKREAREFVKAGSITINEQRIETEDYFVDRNKAIDGEILVLRRGKKKYYIGTII